MVTTQETQQDTAAELALDKREKEILSRRRGLNARLNEVTRRINALHDQLAEYGPTDTVPAALTGALEDAEWDLREIRWDMYKIVADALAVVLDDEDVVYPYTAADVKAWCDRREELAVIDEETGEEREVMHPMLDARTLRPLIRLETIPNAPLREAYYEARRNREERDIITDLHTRLVALEERDGKSYGSKNFMLKGEPQTRYFERVLGLQGVPSGHGGKLGLRLFIPYELGVALMRALGTTPEQAGL